MLDDHEFDCRLMREMVQIRHALIVACETVVQRYVDYRRIQLPRECLDMQAVAKLDGTEEHEEHAQASGLHVVDVSGNNLGSSTREKLA